MGGEGGGAADFDECFEGGAGEIYMLDGDEPVAVVMNATVYTVIIDPMVAEQDEVEKKLTEVLGIRGWRSGVMCFRISRGGIMWWGRNVERRAAEQIAEAELTGVWLQASTEAGCTRRGIGGEFAGSL